MQFPWISESLDQHYSRSIDKCMKSPTEYMSVQTEQKLISDAVKIAEIAKSNKEEIYKSATEYLINKPERSKQKTMKPLKKTSKDEADFTVQ